MTKEQLAEYLGIQSKNISNQNNVFQVSQSIIAKIDIAFWQQEFSVHFSECTFECNYACASSDEIQKVVINIEMSFSECDFKQDISFQRCIFKKNITFFDCHAQEVNISECTFQKDFSFTQSDTLSQKQKSKIDKKFTCGICSFQKINLRGTIFGDDFHCGAVEVNGEANFQSTIFKKRVVLEFKIFKNENNKNVNKGGENTFKKQVSFGYSEFNDVVFLGLCFFEDIVNFSRCEFKKDISFCDSIFKYPLVLYRSKISGKLFLINSKWEINFEKCLQTSNKIFLDRYRYSQHPQNEIAGICRDSFNTIKHILINNNNHLDASKHSCYELYCKEIELDSKPQKSWRDRIDSLQLWFYRHLCNHHTDLLRVWNSLMYLIFIFGVLSFGAMAWFAYYFDDNFSLANCFDSTHLRIFYDSHIKFMIHKHPLRIWGINLGFIALFLFLFLGLTSKICRWIFVIPSYLVSIGMFAISPKLLMPAIGFFTDKREILDPLSIIGGAYTLLFGLIAYSLIKTARKNSIIPS